MGDQFADVGEKAGEKRKAENESGGGFDLALAKAWAEVPRVGQLVGSSPFVPCKRPLSVAANEKVDEGDRFDSNMFMDKQVNQRRDVGLVVALLDPSKGLPLPEKVEWDDWDAEYVIIKPDNAQQAAAAMHRAVQTFLDKQPKRCVAVMCDDGTNLTGYAIVSFLCRARGMPLPQAMAAFAAARSPGIFHEPYVEDLWEHLGQQAMPPGSVPQRPSWALPNHEFVPAHGQFTLPAVKSAPAKPAPQPSGDDLPPGWSKHWSKSHNKEYYFHKETGKQSWDKPTGSSSGKAPSKPPQSSGSTAGALHILVKHAGSRRAASWRDETGAVISQRSLADASAKVESFRKEVLAAPDQLAKFKDIARRESDCSSAHKSGDLGVFAKGKMQPAFEKAVFALKVGEISGLVETDSGVHIILRTA